MKKFISLGLLLATTSIFSNDVFSDVKSYSCHYSDTQGDKMEVQLKMMNGGGSEDIFEASDRTVYFFQVDNDGSMKIARGVPSLEEREAFGYSHIVEASHANSVKLTISEHLDYVMKDDELFTTKQKPLNIIEVSCSRID